MHGRYRQINENERGGGERELVVHANTGKTGTRKVHTGQNESALRGGGGSERVLVVRIESIYLLTSGLGNPALLLGTGLSAVSGASQPGFVEI